MYTLGKIFHVKLLGYAHWFMSIRISQLKDHYIYRDQARYATYIVAKYSQCQMSIYYKYAPDGKQSVVLSYVDDCVYWYNSGALGK